MPPQPLEGFTSAGPSPSGHHKPHHPHHHPQQQQQQHQQPQQLSATAPAAEEAAVDFEHHQQQQQQQLRQQRIMSALQPAAPDSGPRPGYVPLTLMIDFIIQRTYHDLTVLAELLPRKTDMERKIEIYNFTARTEQLCIRLLALVKWAGSSAKVEKSSDIMQFCDKQSMLFIDTADALLRMSREMLCNARLPNFQIPEAIEVLTTGTYSRLPTCIKERIVPIEPVVGRERQQTLLRLNQIIQHRLVTGATLPEQMRNFHIEHGRVQFRVDQEFEVGLTLMSDEPTIPWRMLEIEILVEDSESSAGTGGPPLVHAMQLNFLHHLVQSRLADSANPLQEMYNCLHYFCQSLQLEVLFGQTMHLRQHRLNDSVQVEEYVPGSKLTVSYWREQNAPRTNATTDLLLANKPHRTRSADLGYRLTVQTDPNDCGRPLCVTHLPSIGNRDAAEMANRAMHSDRLSMERLLVHTVYIRSLARLADMRAELHSFMPPTVDYQLRGTPAILTVSILQPCHTSELLHVSVDTHSGQLRCQVPKHPACPLAGDLQAAMNGDHGKLPTLVLELRFWLARRRCEYSLQNQPAMAYEHIPLQLDAAGGVVVAQPEYAALMKSGRNKMFVRYNQHPGVIVVVELTESAERPGEMEYAFHLGFVKAVDVTEAAEQPDSKTDGGGGEKQSVDDGTTVGGKSNAAAVVSPTSAIRSRPASANRAEYVSPSYDFEPFDEEMLLSIFPISPTKETVTDSANTSTSSSGGLPKRFLRIEVITHFDTFAVTHGPSAALFDRPPPTKRQRLLAKREEADADPAADSDCCTSAAAAVDYLVPSLAHTVAMFDTKLPFLALANELGVRAIAHSGLQSDWDASAVCLRVLALPLPPPESAPAATHSACVTGDQWRTLQQRLLDVCWRQQVFRNGTTRNWCVELVFAGSPTESEEEEEGSGPRRRRVVVESGVRNERRSVQCRYEMRATDEIAETVDELLHDWWCVVFLHGLVLQFDEQLRSETYNNLLSDLCTIRSYTYKQLIIGYGPEHESLVAVFWCWERREFQLDFDRLNTGVENPHTIIRSELEAQLNRHHSLAQLVHLLSETHRALCAVAQLEVMPHFGIPRPTVPVLSFCLLPQSPTLIRISYQALYCLELRIHGDGMLSICDGAYSRFEKKSATGTSAADEFTPTHGLLPFLRKYTNYSGGVFVRRRAMGDDADAANTNAPANAFASSLLQPLSSPPPPPPPSSAGATTTTTIASATTLTFANHLQNSLVADALGSGANSLDAHQMQLLQQVSLPPLTISLSFANGTLSKVTAQGGSGTTATTAHGAQSPAAMTATGNAAVAGLRFPTSVTPPPTPASPLAAGNHHQQQQQQHQLHQLQYHNNVTLVTTTSNQQQHLHHNSNSNGVPSPVAPQLSLPMRPASAPIHSPHMNHGSADQSLQSHSPMFGGVQSPAASAAAGRGASPHPAKSVPDSRRAGAVATQLSVEALELLLGVGIHPEADIPGPMMCPLERFLGCVNLRRYLQRYIQSEDFLTPVEPSEPGLVAFRIDNLQFEVSLNSAHMQSLHLKVRPVSRSAQISPKSATATGASPAAPSSPAAGPGNSSNNHNNNNSSSSSTSSIQLTNHQWSALDMQTMERFFDLRVASPPFRANTLYGFCRMLNVPTHVLRDLLRIIRVEMQPAAATTDPIPGQRWHVQLLMRVPPSAPAIVPIGHPAVHMVRHKVLFFLQITRIPAHECQASAAAAVAAGAEPSASPPDSPFGDGDDIDPYAERASLVIPMVYDLGANITQLAERRDSTGTIQSSATNSASQLLRRFAELRKATPSAATECSIFPAIRELLTHYVMPLGDLAPFAMGGGEQQQQQQQQQQPAMARSSGPGPAEQQQQQLQPQLVPSQQSIVIIGGGTANNNGTNTTAATSNTTSSSTSSSNIVKATVRAPSIVTTISSGGGGGGGAGGGSQSQQQPQTVAYTIAN